VIWFVEILSWIFFVENLEKKRKKVYSITCEFEWLDKLPISLHFNEKSLEKLQKVWVVAYRKFISNKLQSAIIKNWNK
jgi:hypothetical protein